MNYEHFMYILSIFVTKYISWHLLSKKYHFLFLWTDKSPHTFSLYYNYVLYTTSEKNRKNCLLFKLMENVNKQFRSKNDCTLSLGIGSTKYWMVDNILSEKIKRFICKKYKPIRLDFSFVSNSAHSTRWMSEWTTTF